jgi:hypothetical protein
MISSLEHTFRSLAKLVLTSCLMSLSTQAQNLVAVHLNRSVEEGISYVYPSQPIGYLDNNCLADDFHVFATWADQTNTELIAAQSANRSQIANKGGVYPVPPGRYLLYTDHIFDRKSSGGVTFKVRVHCYGYGGPGSDYPSTDNLKVTPRIPVHSVSADRSEIVAGTEIEIRVLLTSPAPDSNTRVFLEASSDQLDIPKSVEIDPGWISATVTAKAKADIAEPVDVQIRAFTIGKSQFIRLSLLPRSQESSKP